jgi:hypothetical protein
MILHLAVPRKLTEDLTRPFAPFTESLPSQVTDKQDIQLRLRTSGLFNNSSKIKVKLSRYVMQSPN